MGLENECSDNGDCVGTKCICDTGYTGSKCESVGVGIGRDEFFETIEESGLLISLKTNKGFLTQFGFFSRLQKIHSR